MNKQQEKTNAELKKENNTLREENYGNSQLRKTIIEIIASHFDEKKEMIKTITELKRENDILIKSEKHARDGILQLRNQIIDILNKKMELNDENNELRKTIDILEKKKTSNQASTIIPFKTDTFFRPK